MAVQKSPPTLPATNPQPNPRVSGEMPTHVPLHVVTLSQLKDVKDVHFHLDRTLPKPGNATATTKLTQMQVETPCTYDTMVFTMRK